MSRRLTTRERQVVELLVRGLSHKAIARELGIGLATVRTHVRHAARAITRADPRLPATTRIRVAALELLIT